MSIPLAHLTAAKMSKRISLYRQQKLGIADGAGDAAKAGENPSVASEVTTQATSAQSSRTKMNQEVTKAFETAFGYVPTLEDINSMRSEIQQGISSSLIEKVKSHAAEKEKKLINARGPQQKSDDSSVVKQDDVSKNVKSELTTNGPEKSTVEHEARFGLDGSVIPSVADVSVRHALRPHGNEPEVVGYTLPELLLLMRSSLAGQHRIALLTLTAIARQARCGTLDSNVVLSRFLELNIIPAARTLLDSTSKPVVSQSIDFFFALLLGDDAAEPLKFIEAALFVHTDLFVPRCCPAASVFITTRTCVGEEDDVPLPNTMDDNQVLQIDLVYALVFRLDLGARLLYVMENLLDCSQDAVFINKCLLIMAFLCRHSKQAAEKLYCMPFFEHVVVQGIIKLRKPGYNAAMRLLKFAALASRYVSASLIANSDSLSTLLDWVGQVKETYQATVVDQQTHSEAMQLFIVFAAYDLESAFVDKLAAVMLENVLTSTRVHSLCDDDKSRTYSAWDFSRLAQNFLLLYQCVQFGKGVQLDRKSLDDCIALTSGTVLRWVRLLIIEAKENRGDFAEKMHVGAAKLLNTALLYMVEEVQNLGLMQNRQGRMNARSLFHPTFRALVELLKVSGSQWLKQLKSLRLPETVIEFHPSCVDVPTRQVVAGRLPSTEQRRVKQHVLTCGDSVRNSAADMLNMMKFIHKFLFICVSAGIANDDKNKADDEAFVREWLTNWLNAYEMFVANNPRERFTWHTRPLANASGLALLCVVKLTAEDALHCEDLVRRHCIVLSHLLPEDAGIATMLLNNLSKMLTNTQKDGRISELLQQTKRYLVKHAITSNAGIAETFNGKIDSFLTLKNYDKLLLPKGWEIMPLFSAAEHYRKNNGEEGRTVAVYKRILGALEFLLLLMQSNFSRTKSNVGVKCWPLTVTTTDIYTELGRIFMLCSTFTAPMEEEFNGVSLASLLRSLLPLIVDDNACPCQLDDTFSEKYADLLDDYGATSYGNLVYTQFILIPLRTGMSPKLKAMFWRRAMQIGFLRLISLGRDDLLYKSDQFFGPAETDLAVVGLYAQCLVEQSVTKGRNALLYEILVRQVGSFVNGTDVENDAYRQRLQLTLANQADKVLLCDLNLS